ncbi:antiviral reverse transcriptase Drt2 [Acinetobacter sp. V91_7]|uniref:antiviral reverse transcriptase Drt2 n=1 Tax=unclassified Acinetobacter TaxID=196816 RepID=UPI00287C2CF4|nr:MULTISPECIES: antiviral reverse transcriptase Drt2 [unclassified Acinetobacter]MDS7935183.1 antiviral reverse transcriptase Drt2 [Acinetobacter sp. V91_4B]MDS7963993.1 antiviral reverse transcriptase Drt2 [Acinetobacter sp. V91_7]MDS8027114.1 antiviral reverse transcriptase Drt2 [Acinetobacter sp. V91_13]
MLNFNQYKEEIYDKKHRINDSHNNRLKSRVHFDTPLDVHSAFELVSNPDKVSKHWFLPFIGFDQSVRKIRRHNGLTRRVSKVRPLRYAANKDGYIYAYYSYLLDRQYENLIKKTSLNNSVLAYRSLGKSNVDFAKEVFDWIAQTQGCNVLTIDLSSFFDTLDHEILKKQWQKVNNVDRLSQDNYMVFKSLTNYSFMNIEDALLALGWSDKLNRKRLGEKIPNPLRKKTSAYHQSLKDFRDIRKYKFLGPNESFKYLIQFPERIEGKRYGIPQGSPMSAVLSNIYMLDFDYHCCDLMEKIGGLYRRYCDDIIVLFPENVQINDIYIALQSALGELGGSQLKINPTKVEKIQFINESGQLKAVDASTKVDKPLQYLGFTYNGKKILIRSSSISNYYRRLVSKIRSSKNKASQNNSILYRRKIYRMYSHLARKQRNFITYAYRASETMEDSFIKRQLSNHWQRIHHEINK